MQLELNDAFCAYMCIVELNVTVNNINILNAEQKCVYGDEILSLHRAVREITSTINQQMHLYNFHLKQFKTTLT